MEFGQERRDYFRVEGQVLLDYRKLEGDAQPGFPPWSRVPVVPLSQDSQGGISAEGRKGRVLDDLVQRLQRIEEKLDGLLAVNGRAMGEDVERLTPWAVSISGSGMRFPTRERLQTGDRIEVTLVLPIMPHYPIRLAGEVVHVLDAGQDCAQGRAQRPFDTAIRFVSLSDAERERIIRFATVRQYEAGSKSVPRACGLP